MAKLKKEIRKTLSYLIKKMPWSYQDRIIILSKNYLISGIPTFLLRRFFTERLLMENMCAMETYQIKSSFVTI